MSQNQVEDVDVVDIDNPPLLDYGFVVGRYVTAIVDSPVDVDRYPDLRAIPGRVEFEPLQEIHLKGAPPYPATVVQQPFSIQIDKQGYITDEQSLGAPAPPVRPEGDVDDNPLILNRPGLYLISGVYRVRTVFRNVNDIAEFTINVTADHTKANPLDLTEQKPLVTPPGYTEVVRIVDRVRAEEAAEAAEVYRDETREFARTDAFTVFVEDAEAARDHSRLFAEASDRHRAEAREQRESAETARDDALSHAEASQESAVASHEALAELNNQVALAREQADRSATEADRSTTEADRSVSEADRSSDEADRARAEADNAKGSASEADASHQEASQKASDAATSAQEAEGQASTALSHAEAAEAERRGAEGHAAEASTHADTAGGHSEDAGAKSEEASGHADRAGQEADRSEAAAGTAETHRDGAEASYQQSVSLVENFSFEDFPLATPDTRGLMPSEDKRKLDEASNSYLAAPNSIVLRGGNGNVATPLPRSPSHATNKEYVDDVLGALANITVSPTEPENPQEGDIWLDTSEAYS